MMTGLRVLDAGDPAGTAEWLRLWSSWPSREVMAHPGYCRLFARPGDRTICISLEEGSGGVLYPLVVRPLAAEPWARAGEKRVDAVTPYGYGGPFAWGASARLGEQFWSSVERWFAEQNVVSSFARLSLFQDQLLPFRGDVQPWIPNVVRRLDQPAEALWKDYAHKVRKNVNAARRGGLTVEFDRVGARLDEFVAIYTDTMERRGAASTYYFPREFFEAITRDLAGQFVFAHVLAGKRIVSTELVLCSAEHIYSFLGGTLADAFELRPNDLLKHAVIEWGQREGKKAYILGGGPEGRDGIFRYKLAFAPRGEIQFNVGRAVHDPAAYEDLVAARRAFEGARGVPWEPRPQYFPAYRA